MSRPQDPHPHRPFFSFGNPFKMILPKGSHMSPKLLSILNSFEEILAGRLRKLVPKHKGEILGLTWMKSAIESLCETHNDIKTLVTSLELPVTDWDQKWVDVYLDISIRLLDICNAFTSEITRLNQGNLLLQCALHNLESGTAERYIKARSSLDSWRQHISTRNPRVQNCRSILESLMESLDLPKVKKSAKGKVLMHAMYGVKVETIFVCSVFAAVFSNSSKNLLDLSVPDTVVWAQAFNDLQTGVNEEVRERFSCGKVTTTGLKELVEVESIAKKMYPMIEDGMEEEAVKSCLKELQSGAEEVCKGLDMIGNQVDNFFKIVLSGRDALLCNIRVFSNKSDSNDVRGVSSTREQVVR
ncbi:Protein BPS1, chloroplastic [Linum grandiflorum]